MYDVITDRLRVIAYDVKYFDRLKLSINVSIMKERIESPSRENSPVSISKIKNPDAVINASEINNALPMSKLEYFFRIIAMISVPPLEEPMLKRIADPSAGRAMAKHNSSIGSSVKGECIGKSRSSTESETERRMLQ